MPSIIDFSTKRMCWLSPTQKYEAEEKLWAEFFRIERTIMCSVFSSMDNHKKWSELPYFLTENQCQGESLVGYSINQINF